MDIKKNILEEMNRAKYRASSTVDEIRNKIDAYIWNYAEVRK